MIDIYMPTINTTKMTNIMKMMTYDGSEVKRVRQSMTMTRPRQAWKIDKETWMSRWLQQTINDDRAKPNGMPPCHHIIDFIASQCLQQLKQYQQDYSCIPGFILHLCKNWSIEKGKAVSNKQWHRG